MNAFCSKQMNISSSDKKNMYSFDDSFIEELIKRGYDLDTLKFSIRKKEA
jgi:hypothetical protein